jgi:uncharacterized membrane protein (Fun14 family)
MSDAPKPNNASADSPEAPPWRKGLIVLVLLMVVGAVGARWATYEAPVPKPVASTLHQTGTKLGQLKGSTARQVQRPVEAAEDVEAEGLLKYLPYVSEGGLALLLGVGLGMASRAFAKLLAVGVFLGFVALQYFAHQGIVSVDYAALFEWIKQFVFNISGGGDLVATLTDKIPAFGSLGAGYLIGIKK